MLTLERLPLFPLGVVLYPYERLPLHIFEPRYKEMIGRCVEGGEPFGMVFSSEDKLAEVGCTARVSQVVQRYEDGRMDIIVTGEQRFRLGELHRDLAYLTVDGELVPESREPLNKDLKERAITQHMRLLELVGRQLRPSVYERSPLVSYVLGHNSGLTDAEKQELLEIPAENDRIDYLIRHFETLIPRIEQRETLRQKIHSNG